MTSLTKTDSSIEGDIRKSYELGRVRTPRSQREAILAQFEGSGSSGAAFAAYVRVKYLLRARETRDRGENPVARNISLP